MSSNWTPYALPRPGGVLLGENNTDALTKDVFQSGWFTRVRNYHLGRDGFRKREGTQPWQGNGNAINGSNAVQSLAMYDWGTTRYLMAVAAGNLYYSNSGAWTQITGATIASGQNSLLRWTQFSDGTNSYIVGTDNVNTPFKWSGSGNAAALGGTPPTHASDICEFEGCLFAINTDGGSTAVEHSDEGNEDSWSAGNLFHCTRASDGVALVKHTDSVLLAMHRKSVHAIRFEYVDTGVGDSYFRRDLVDGSSGPSGRGSCVNFRGYTYFASDDGIYRIPPSGGENSLPPPAVYISRPIEKFWSQLNPARTQYVAAFVRGRPWNEVCFLVTTGQGTQHDAVLVFNAEWAELYGHEAAWSIFDSIGGYLSYNCGIDFVDSSNRHVTILGGHDSVVDEAFGNDEYSTGYKDNGSTGSAVQTELTTGYVACGMEEWTKGLRQFEIDMNIQGNRDFTLTIYGTNATTSIVSTTEAVAPGDVLTETFIFGTSYFAVDGVSDHFIEVDGSSRYFQAGLVEASEEKPHSIYAVRFMFVPEFLGVH